MPIVVPPFAAYQSPLYPLPGKWNARPVEGDKFVPVEIDWGVTVPQGQAVQIALNAGPLEFSQIVALGVDNGRNGGSVSFLFPDTGKQLTLPPFAQGTYPVFTNSLTFYVVPDGSTVGDVTVFEILNSVPPPVSVLPAQLQSHSGLIGADLTTTGTHPIVSGNGTLQGFTISASTTGTGTVNVQLQDGTGAQIWAQIDTAPNPINVSQSGLSIRFTNGLFLVIVSSTLTAASSAVVNVYYSIP